jgi:hypothetical protein
MTTGQVAIHLYGDSIKFDFTFVGESGVLSDVNKKADYFLKKIKVCLHKISGQYGGKPKLFIDEMAVRGSGNSEKYLEYLSFNNNIFDIETDGLDKSDFEGVFRSLDIEIGSFIY